MEFMCTCVPATLFLFVRMLSRSHGGTFNGFQGWPAADSNTRPGLAALRQGLVGRFAPGRENVVSGGVSHWDEC